MLRMLLYIWFMLLGFVGFLFLVAYRPGLPTPREDPSIKLARQQEADRIKRQQEEQEKGMALLVLGVRSIQRNPEAFRVAEAYIGKENSQCLHYRGQNGFGGMTGGMAVRSGALAYHDKEPQFG